MDIKTQPYSPTASIANWLDGRKASVALTFDDWLPGQYEIALPILTEAQLPASYYVTLSNLHIRPNFDHWGLLQRLIDTGNEVGNHTMTHKDLSAISREERMYEIYHAKLVLDSRLNNATVDTIAYPFGLYNQDVIDDVRHGHIGGRTFNANKRLLELGVDRYVEDFVHDSIKTENDFYRVNELSLNNDIQVGDVVEIIQRVTEKKGFLPLVIHGVYSEENPHDKDFYDAVDHTHFKNMVKALLSFKNDVWFTTFSQAIKYRRATEKLSIEHCFSDNYGSDISRYEYHLKKQLDPFGVKLDFPKMTVLFELSKSEQCEMVLQSEKPIEFTQEGRVVKANVNPSESIIAIRVKDMTYQNMEVENVAEQQNEEE